MNWADVSEEVLSFLGTFHNGPYAPVIYYRCVGRDEDFRPIYGDDVIPVGCRILGHDPPS